LKEAKLHIKARKLKKNCEFSAKLYNSVCLSHVLACVQHVAGVWMRKLFKQLLIEQNLLKRVRLGILWRYLDVFQKAC